MAFGGVALKSLQTILYVLCFCCSAIILGIFSYFLSALSSHHQSIPGWEKAVEGMSGIGVVYTIFAVILTCFLGGVTFFAFLAIVMDVLLCGAFIAIAILTRHGVGSCSGTVHTPLGTGPSNSRAGYGSNGFGTGNGESVVYSSSLGFACKLEKVCFAVAVIGAFLFLISAVVQLCLGRHHKREKAFGPSPTNNYTSGTAGKKKWFGRKNKKATTSNNIYAKDTEATGGLAPTTGTEYRPSHETGYTGTTADHDGTYAGNKYESTQPVIPTNGGYHTGPTGTGVNPYGYENNRTAGTNF